MTDRELLEMAAKAAGVPIEYRAAARENVGNSLTNFQVTAWHGPFLLGTDDGWNPLTDDGDALRLATSLCMSISTGPCEASASTIQGALRGAFPRASTVTQCQAEAVRRVIVEAAAEVGRAM